VIRQCLCGGRDFDTVFEYREPPAGEVRFALAGEYRRRIVRCARCGHFVSQHDMDMSGLYSGAYVEATYGADGLRRAFDRITALPPERSDNAGRVTRVVEYARGHFGHGKELSVLDVGSGLCVFLHRLKSQTGWRCTALDPDPRAAAHARDVVGVEAISGDFMRIEPQARYDLVTFNKVLEHVVDPVAMLKKAADYLLRGGAVYLEVPDAEAAMTEGAGREEFFIDHHHVFSPESTRILAERAGFAVSREERLREASSKYTLRAFLTPRADVRET
jgi:SAM-dependent methyltransferase